MIVCLGLAGPSVESPPAAAPALSSLKTTPAAPVAAQDPSSLVNLLSEVDMSPADLLGALSKVQGQGSFDGENKDSFTYFEKINK